jgi:hypothetical protein
MSRGTVQKTPLLILVLLSVVLLCLSAYWKTSYVTAFTSSEVPKHSNEKYIADISKLRDKLEGIRDNPLQIDRPSSTADSVGNAAVLPTEVTTTTEDSVGNAAVLPTEVTTTTEDSVGNAAVLPTEVTTFSERTSMANSITNQSSSGEGISGPGINLNIVSQPINNSSMSDGNNIEIPAADEFTLSSLEPGTPTVTNDTSLSLEPGTPTVTNDTSLFLEPGTPTVTNDTSGNQKSNSITNSSIPSLLLDHSMQVSGPTAGKSVGVASASDPNSVVKKIIPGDPRGFTFRNISDKTNSSKEVKIKFDNPNGYNIGDTATLTVTDPAANLDPKQVNTIVLSISTESDRRGILVLFTETGKNTGKFKGSFIISDGPSSTRPTPTIQSKAGDKIEVVYVASHSRLTATLDGVTTGGEVVIKDFALSSTQKQSIDWNPIGNGAQLSFTGVQTNSEPTITITMSYADAYIEGNPPDQFEIFKSTNGGEDWELVNNLASEDSSAVVDPVLKTVTIQTTVDPLAQTIFMIASGLGGGSGGFGSPGGGGGGGLGLPGNGVVLDLLAPVVASNPPSEPPLPSTGPSSSLPPSFLTITNQRTVNPTPGISLISVSKTNISSDQSQNDSKLLENDGSRFEKSAPVARNFTIILPQIGTVVLSFTNLMSQGPISVIPVQSQLGLSQLKMDRTIENNKLLTVNIDKTMYTVLGTPLEIRPTSAMFNGRITVSIPYTPSLVHESDQIRLLYFNGGNWEDLTSGVNTQTHHVTGELESLGTVIAAAKSSS